MTSTYDLAKVAEDSARGGFFLISGTALATVVLAIASIMIGRILGPDLYGQYTLAFVVPQLLFLFTDLGINQGIIKYAASLRATGDADRLARIVRYGLVIRTLAAIIVFLVNYTFAYWLASIFLQRPDLVFYVRIASTGILFQAIFSTVTSAFVGIDRAEYNALITNVQAVAKTLISILLVLLGFSVLGAIIGNVASFAISGLAGLLILLFFTHRRKKGTKTLPKDEISALMKYAVPLYISVVITGFIPVFKNLILAMFVTDAEIGNYKAAINFAALMAVISVPITTALLPAFSKLDSVASQETKTFFRLSNKYTAMLTIPITVLIIMYSSEIVQIVYGSTYHSASLFLAIYCLLYFLVGFGYLTLASFFNGLGETRISLVVSLITFLSLAVLSPILTKAYGVPGLIIAFLIGSTAGTIYGLYTARRRFQIIFDTPSLIKIYSISLLSALPPVLIVRFVSLPPVVHLALGGSLFILIYATLVPLTQVVSAAELQMTRSITRKIPLLSLLARPILRYEQKLLKVRNEPKSTNNP